MCTYLKIFADSLEIQSTNLRVEQEAFGFCAKTMDLWTILKWVQNSHKLGANFWNLLVLTQHKHILESEVFCTVSNFYPHSTGE